MCLCAYMCVCICSYVCVCALLVHVCVCSLTCVIRVRACVCTHMCSHVNELVCAACFARACVCAACFIFPCMCVRAREYSVCVLACSRVCVRARACTCA